MATFKIENCNQCPFLFLDEYKGKLCCSNPNNEKSIDFSELCDNERMATINVIHKDCKLRFEPTNITL